MKPRRRPRAKTICAKKIKARIANKEMHPNMMENVWLLGRNKQKESNVLVVRLASEQNSRKKKVLREAIVKQIIEKNDASKHCQVGSEMDGLPSWQVMMRSMENNLKLS